MTEENRIEEILSIIQKIERSELSVRDISKGMMFRFLARNTTSTAKHFRKMVKKGFEISEKMEITQN